MPAMHILGWEYDECTPQTTKNILSCRHGINMMHPMNFWHARKNINKTTFDTCIIMTSKASKAFCIYSHRTSIYYLNLMPHPPSDWCLDHSVIHTDTGFQNFNVWFLIRKLKVLYYWEDPFMLIKKRIEYIPNFCCEFSLFSSWPQRYLHGSR